jgi:hypothetical protein
VVYCGEWIAKRRKRSHGLKLSSAPGESSDSAQQAAARSKQAAVPLFKILPKAHMMLLQLLQSSMGRPNVAADPDRMNRREVETQQEKCVQQEHVQYVLREGSI